MDLVIRGLLPLFKGLKLKRYYLILDLCN